MILVVSDDDLRLNTLHRFAKHSPRLVLEEYSHCEVPAGCGGAVLRWLDPQEGIAARIEVRTLGSVETWLDATLVHGSHVTISPGAHTLFLHVKELGTSWHTKGQPPMVPAPFTASVRRGTQEGGADLLGVHTSWSWSSRNPGRVIADPQGELEGFTELPLAPALLEGLPERARYPLDRTVQRGQPIMALGAAGTTEAWVVIRFAYVPEATK